MSQGGHRDTDDVALIGVETVGLVTAAGTPQSGPSHRMDGEGWGAPAQRGDTAGLRCLPPAVFGESRCAGRGDLLVPILAGLKEARLSEGSLQESFKPCRLYHPAGATYYRMGMTCKNFLGASKESLAAIGAFPGRASLQGFQPQDYRGWWSIPR